MGATGIPKRKPLTETEFQRMDQLLRDCPDLDFNIIASRMGCHRSIVQIRNKERGIRVFPRTKQQEKPKFKTRFDVKYKHVKGGFL